MKKNFLIDQAVGVIYEGRYFDLHNCYNFQGFEFEVVGKKFRLVFECSDSALTTPQTKILIEFIDVSVLELSYGFTSHINQNLVEMGYKNADDRDYDWLVEERNAFETDHLFFRFDSDEYIRIYGCNVMFSFYEIMVNEEGSIPS